MLLGSTEKVWVSELPTERPINKTYILSVLFIKKWYVLLSF